MVLMVSYRAAQDDTGVTMSLDVPIGDATIGVDNSGDVTHVWYIGQVLQLLTLLVKTSC